VPGHRGSDRERQADPGLTMLTITLHDGRIVTVTESGHVYVYPPDSTREVAGYSLTLPTVEPLGKPRSSRRRIRRELLAALRIR
jgi:hypothetical protein